MCLQFSIKVTRACHSFADCDTFCLQLMFNYTFRPYIDYITNMACYLNDAIA